MSEKTPSLATELADRMEKLIVGHCAVALDHGRVAELVAILRAGAAMREALDGLAKRRTGEATCFCAFFNGGPLVKAHSAPCDAARKALSVGRVVGL